MQGVPNLKCRSLDPGSDSDIKNPNQIQTVQKFDIRIDGFPTETVCIRSSN